jgi:hypothetical protein
MTVSAISDTTRARRRSRVVVLWALAVAAAYSWVAAGFHPFTWPMRVAVAVPALVAVACTKRVRRQSRVEVPARSSSYRWCVAGWLGLLIAAIVWELTAFFSSPRDDHPTLSSIADDVMRTHPGRAATFALWLLVGWLLFVRPVLEREA